MDDSPLDVSRRWWDEVWAAGALDVIDEIFTDPFLRHSAVGSAVTSVADYKATLADVQRALFRPQTTIDDRVVAGDRVWTRATSRGVSRETGDTVIVSWLLVQRVLDGRIAEQWSLTARDVDWVA